MKAMIGMAFLAAAVLMAGCTEYLDRRETVSFGAGNAQQANLITHVVSPLPPHAADRDLLFHGQRVGGAVERYRTGGNAGPAAIGGEGAAGPAAAEPAGTSVE